MLRGIFAEVLVPCFYGVGLHPRFTAFIPVLFVEAFGQSVGSLRLHIRGLTDLSSWMFSSVIVSSDRPEAAVIWWPPMTAPRRSLLKFYSC